MSESTWAATPAAETFQAVQKLVAGYVLMPTDDEVLDCAAAGIRRAIDRLNMRTWNWALVYDTVTFVAGTQEYDIQRPFKKPRNFSIRSTAGIDSDRLSFLPWGTFLKEAQDNRTSGDPQYYSVPDSNAYGVLRLDMAPSASWVALNPTGRLWYYRRVQYPSAAGTSLDVPSEVVGFIQSWAEGFTADRYARGNAPSAYARARDFLHELIVDDCHGQQTDWE